MIRPIYEHQVFKQLRSVVCKDPRTFDPDLYKVFLGLRAFRDSRDIPSHSPLLIAWRFLLGYRVEHSLASNGGSDSGAIGFTVS